MGFLKTNLVVDALNAAPEGVDVYKRQHHNILRCHKRKFLFQMLSDHSRIYFHTTHYIDVQMQNRIYRKRCV